MDFQLTEEQIAIRDVVREFVEREIKPVAMERDKIQDPAERFPWDLVEKGSALGLRTLTVPERYGGADVDLLTTCILGEELAAGDLGVAVIFDQCWKIAKSLSKMMTREQADEFFPRFVEDPRHLLAISLTEPEFGSDRFFVTREPGIKFKTTATRRDGGYVINGRKQFISNAGVAKTYMVWAATDSSKSMFDGSSAFVVPYPSPGFEVTHLHRKIGQRLGMNAEFVFEDCWIPEGNRLGDENKAFALRAQIMKDSNIEAAATALGVGRAAYEAALEWARTRVQGGRRIIEHQAVGNMLADMHLKIEAARTMIWRAAWVAEHDHTVRDGRWGSMAKIMASEVAFDVARLCLEIHGGYGIMEELPVEKYLRDASTFLHSDGTNQIQRVRMAAWLDGADPNEWPGAAYRAPK